MRFFFHANYLGRMFDKGGDLRQWWTNETIVEYVNRTNCFVKQYGSYYVPEVKEYVRLKWRKCTFCPIVTFSFTQVNGEQTLGENIADNGGLREAYHAYRLYVRQSGKEMQLPGFEDYTHDQLFFMSFGNVRFLTFFFISYYKYITFLRCGAKHKHLRPLNGH